MAVHVYAIFWVIPFFLQSDLVESKRNTTINIYIQYLYSLTHEFLHFPATVLNSLM